MPKRLGLNVRVIDTNNNAFIEYGLQSDQRFKTERLQVSTFIEAKNNTQFLISVTVDHPFKFKEGLDPIARLAAVVESQNAAPPVRGEHNTRTKHFDENRPVEEEVRSPIGSTSVDSQVPFDLMVSIFIDGRAKPECRQIIYLDPKNPRYNACCVLKGRWVEPGDAFSQNDRAGLLQWVFSDRGIEHILGKLDVKKMDDNPSTNPVKAELRAICDDIGEGLFKEPEDKRMKAGTIEVRFRRIIVLQTRLSDQTFKAYHYSGHDEKPREIDDDCTHTTSFLPKTSSKGLPKMETFPLRTVGWNYFKKGEDFWANFVFKYTARHKLVNLKLSGPDGKPTLAGRISRPEPEISTKGGKKRATSIEGNDDEELRRAEDSSAKKLFTGDSKGKEFQRTQESDSVSEEDPDDSAAYFHEHGRYESRVGR